MNELQKRTTSRLQSGSLREHYVGVEYATRRVETLESQRSFERHAHVHID
jgi:hypothetical protein